MRTARKQAESGIYHVIVRGVGRRIIFEDEWDYSRYRDSLERFANKNDVKIYAWCLMDNHAHLVLHGLLPNIGKTMGQLGSTYALHYNRRNDHVGHVFQGRFKSEPIETDAHLMTVIRYVHQNPVKAGVGTLDGYRWSSYREYTERASLCDTTYALGVFGSKSEFERFHQEGADILPCLSAETNLRDAEDETLRALAQQAIGSKALSELGMLPKEKRNEKLAALRRAGLSVRQIERLTGIGRNIIARAK